jgi:hypothetical protein
MTRLIRDGRHGRRLAPGLRFAYTPQEAGAVNQKGSEMSTQVGMLRVPVEKVSLGWIKWLILATAVVVVTAMAAIALSRSSPVAKTKPANPPVQGTQQSQTSDWTCTVGRVGPC